MTNLSGMWNVNLQDLFKSLVNAVIAGVVLALAGIASQANFDLFTVDWASVGHVAVNAAFAAFVGSLGRRFVTDDSGKVFGRL